MEEIGGGGELRWDGARETPIVGEDEDFEAGVGGEEGGREGALELVLTEVEGMEERKV